MITDGMMRRQQLLEQETAQNQIQMMDQQLGVGPWGQSLAPLAQPHRDNLSQLATDPQAFNRRLLEMGQEMPNPFGGGGGMLGGGYGGGSQRRPQDMTQITAPGRPAGSMSFTQQSQKSKFPNPFS